MDERINAYLKKYSTLYTPDRVREHLITYCNRELGIVLSKKDITLRNGTARITSNASVKSELFLHRTKIVEELRRVFGTDAPRTIR